MTSDFYQIRRSVTAHYGARARRAAGETIPLELVGDAGDACCGDDCCMPSDQIVEEGSGIQRLYDLDQLEGLPQGALEAAAGCGNPVAIAELRPGEVVLDLGSGGGIDCFLAARRVGPEGRVIGVDMTPDMVALARRNASELGLTNVVFKLAEIEDLPLADGSVDVIISNCVINLAPDKEPVLREAFRVLRPGGRLRISDMVWLGDRPAQEADLDAWAGCVAGALPLDQFRAGLERAGFIEVVAQPRPVSDDGRLASALISATRPA